jgi:hypothetical protein
VLIWKVLKCGTRQRYRRSVGPILWNMTYSRSQGGEEYLTNNINTEGSSLRRNCVLKHVIEGKIEGRIGVTGRRGKRCKQLRMTLRKGDVTGLWKLKHWIARFGKGYRSVVRETRELMCVVEHTRCKIIGVLHGSSRTLSSWWWLLMHEPKHVAIKRFNIKRLATDGFFP